MSSMKQLTQKEAFLLLQAESDMLQLVEGFSNKQASIKISASGDANNVVVLHVFSPMMIIK
jgi:hypothetical protein